MAKTRKHREYRFEIDAFSPTTIPMSRLAEYISDLAKMFGNNNSVHLLKIEQGSTVPVIMVEWEAEPKVRDRFKAIKSHEHPTKLNKRPRISIIACFKTTLRLCWSIPQAVRCTSFPDEKQPQNWNLVR